VNGSLFTVALHFPHAFVEAFLLDNGIMYHAANTIALVEYLVTLYFKPALKTYTKISTIGMIRVLWVTALQIIDVISGIALVLLGQGLRSVAMIHASTNFSHSVAFRKRPSHQLVTGGVYA
jgi:protein-S-isoprenylcysteine O-methyltransferase